MPKKEKKSNIYERVCAERDRHGIDSRIGIMAGIVAAKIETPHYRPLVKNPKSDSFIKELDEDPGNYVRLAKDELKCGQDLINKKNITARQITYRSAALCYAAAKTMLGEIEKGEEIPNKIATLNNLHKCMGELKRTLYHDTRYSDSNAFSRLREAEDMYKQIKYALFDKREKNQKSK